MSARIFGVCSLIFLTIELALALNLNASCPTFTLQPDIFWKESIMYWSILAYLPEEKSRRMELFGFDVDGNPYGYQVNLDINSTNTNSGGNKQQFLKYLS